LPDYLRGWGVVTGTAAAHDGKPRVVSMTELLLVAPSGEGPQLRSHDWGGSYSLEWSNFIPPPDPRVVPLQDYAALKPYFEAILSRQTARLLEQITVQ